MVTGSVTCSPAQPQIRIGTRVRLPVKYWFRGYEQKENVVGYVVEVNESVSIDPSVGTMVSSTNFLFVRGQPENGLEVPNPVPWKVAE
jgi:hypothetical protein